jgi:hypothetical protein
MAKPITIFGKAHFFFLRQELCLENNNLGSFGIRQQLSEDAFRHAIMSFNASALRSPAKLLDFHIDESREYPVSARVDFNGTVREVNRYAITST